MAVARSDVADRYAAAFFDLAVDTNALEKLEGDLITLQKALTDSQDLKRLAESPVFNVEAKTAGFAAVLEKSAADPMTRNLIALLAKNRRLGALSAVIASFRQLAADHRGEVSAEATSARALTDDQVKALRSQIETSVGKSVNLDTKIDPSLLGGLIVKVGSRMVDSSLRTKLNRLQQTLKEA